MVATQGEPAQRHRPLRRSQEAARHLAAVRRPKAYLKRTSRDGVDRLDTSAGSWVIIRR
jgi:hypothetical protein